jgi:Rieske Fe-S protein
VPDEPKGVPAPQWREDFPVQWERDHYVTRRELTKFLTLGSGLLAGASAAIAAVGLLRRPGAAPRVRIGAAADVQPGRPLLFRYPTDEDPCIVVRLANRRLAAYSQVCTHLSCAVVHRPEEGALFCPCHHGVFSERDGRPVAGPPSRRLPRVRIERIGDDLFAVGVEV